jgi:hypothetical protein
MSTVKAISLWEPWASYMGLELKTIETRSWPTKHRGDLLICAALRKVDGSAEALMGALSIVPELHHGLAVCVVELCDCVPVEQVRHRIGKTELALGDYSNGRWAWLTRNMRVVDHVPVKGKQGMFWAEMPRRI